MPPSEAASRFRDLNLWRRNLTAGEFLYGVSWAAIAFTASIEESQAAYFFLFAALMVVTAIRMLFAASVMPILACWYGTGDRRSCASVFDDGPGFLWLMAVVAVGIHFYFIFLVKNLQRTRAFDARLPRRKDRLMRSWRKRKRPPTKPVAKAEAANLAKSKFLANMSHDFARRLTPSLVSRR